MYKTENIRNMVVGPDKAVDFRDTKVTNGLVVPSKAFKMKNETKEYETGKTSMGALGGENTNS